MLASVRSSSRGLEEVRFFPLAAKISTSSSKEAAVGRRKKVNATKKKARKKTRTDAESQQGDFPRRHRGVVGIGASAGGLQACSELLKAIPDDFDLPILVVQHLAPDQESHFYELLDSACSLPVQEAEDGLEIAPGRVHVIPPAKKMELQDGRLKISPVSRDRTRLDTVDVLFSSIAREAGNRGIGVVLSGTASDGAAGLRDIKAAGGITVVQDPQTAPHPGMPRAAIATGIVDLVLPVTEIAHELSRLLDHPFLDDDETDESDVGIELREDEVTAERRKRDISVEDLKQVLEVVRNDCGVDFHEYKGSTLRRRLKRRMALRRVDNVEDYLALLEEDRDEVQTLAEDILINVTSFFREPKSFEVLASTVFPALVEEREKDAPIRIWVPGCSSGEEAYSVAIQLLDFLGEEASSTPIQIFATDVSEPTIERARTGWFPESIENDVPEDYLRRFFREEEHGYRIHKSIRDLCVISRQDLIRDPPFSRIDLIVCRNVLIYMTEPLQRRLAKIFHYALVPSGFLMLGAAETLVLDRGSFELIDKEARLYRKKPGTKASLHDLPAVSARTPREESLPARPQPRAVRSIEDEARRITLIRYAPPSVLVDANFQIVDTQGHTGPYLELAPGEPSLNVLKMAREGLSRDLRKALKEAGGGNQTVRRTGVQVRQDGTFQPVNLEVVPLRSEDNRRHFLVYFENPEPRDPPPAPETVTPEEPEGERSEEELERELEENREYLQSVINDLEAANEELQSANEEILSSNEELQSTNEELDTAKEELQSTNEELNTINDELESRNDELTRVNSDLLNLFANVQMALVILSRDLRIRRLTPMAQELLNIIPADVGRPIGQIKPNIDCPDLEVLIERCVDEVESVERQVRDHDGRWYSLRIRPYKDLEDRIDGAVLTLVDIDELRRHEAEVQAARQFSEAIVDTIKEPLVVLTHDLKVELVNPAFVSLFGISSEKAKEKPFYELGQGQWDVALLRERLEEVISKEKPVDRFRVQAPFNGLGEKRFWVNARRIEAGEERPELILVTLEDVSVGDATKSKEGSGP